MVDLSDLRQRIAAAKAKLSIVDEERRRRDLRLLHLLKLVEKDLARGHYGTEKPEEHFGHSPAELRYWRNELHPRTLRGSPAPPQDASATSECNRLRSRTTGDPASRMHRKRTADNTSRALTVFGLMYRRSVAALVNWRPVRQDALPDASGPKASSASSE